MKKKLPTIVIRHQKENLKKCSLRGLEKREDFQFFRYPINRMIPSLDEYVLLTMNANKTLSKEDKDHGLLILDATWRYAEKMERLLCLPSSIKKRSLPPHIQTAYPRKQFDCSDPTHGLASIEAIYCAYFLLEQSTEGLLDRYRWKEMFIEKNRALFAHL